MKTYTITKVSGAPDWEKIPALDIGEKYFDTPADMSAEAKIAYDSERIYVRLSTVESETRAVETDPLGSPCEDSCLEFFFCPMEGDNRYFNIEFNSNACIYCGFGSSVNNLVRLAADEDYKFAKTFSPNIDLRDNGWNIEYSIPFEFIRRFFPDFQVYGGKKIRANCYKCSDLTVPSNYMAWNPIVGEPFKFHRPECFGEMTFSN